MNFKRFHESKNLFDKDNATVYDTTIASNGGWYYGNGACVRIPISGNTTYTISTSSIQDVFRLTEISSTLVPTENNPINGSLFVRTSNINSYTFTTSENAKYIVFQASNLTVQDWLSELMLNTGSQPLPYEPYSSEVWHNIPHYIHNTSTDTLTTLPADIYANDTTATVGISGNMEQSGTPSPATPIQPSECGDLETTGEHAGQYKIPISSASTTTPVYLGEVESTRRINKLVLTGESVIYKNDPTSYLYYVTDVPHKSIDCICSHLPSTNSYPIGETGGIYSKDSSHPNIMYINLSKSVMEAQPSGNTVAGFKEYLAQQYANGTPVTVWYVLETETTGIVNEPIRKIGDYADTVSGITVPTITGKDTFDVETTLKPSEVELTYTGWHDSTVKEWDGSDWQ